MTSNPGGGGLAGAVQLILSTVRLLGLGVRVRSVGSSGAPT